LIFFHSKENVLKQNVLRKTLPVAVVMLLAAGTVPSLAAGQVTSRGAEAPSKNAASA